MGCKMIEHTNSNELATKTYKFKNYHVNVLLCIWCLMVRHFFYLTGKHKKGTRKLTAVKWWDERRGFLLCITFCVPSTVTQNLFLSLGCCPNPALIAHRLIYHQLFYPSLTTAFSSRLSRSLFLCHWPYCPPHSFNACFVHPSLPLPLSLSLHFSRTQLDMWMNTWNSPWGVERSVSMLMTPALLNTNTLHRTTMRVIWPFSTASVS